MNDRFKFRLWDVQNQKYLYFDLFDSESLNDFAFFASEEAPDYNEQIKCPDTNCWELKLEQCTGLKDKNGELIYEGDILSLYKLKNPIVVICKWNIDKWVFVDTSGCIRNDYHMEIIGNVHENPELLENKYE